MTRMITCTTQDDIPVKGVHLQVVDNKIEAVVVTDEDGNSVRIVKSSDYSSSLKVLKEQGKVPVDKWYVCGKLLNLVDYEEEFDDEYKAQDHLDSIKSDKGIWDTERLGLKIEQRTVMVDATKIN